jgi:hypothetical protein
MGMADEAHKGIGVQSDGKFVVAGIINGYGNASGIGLYRYLP